MSAAEKALNDRILAFHAEMKSLEAQVDAEWERRKQAAKVEFENSQVRKVGSAAAASKSLNAGQREQARQLFKTAFELFQSGDFATARTAFGRGLNVDPGNANAQFYLAETLMRLKDEAAAYEHYWMAWKLAPLSKQGLQAETALGKLSAYKPSAPVPTRPTIDAIASLEVGNPPIIFRDCSECPEMIMVPAGAYQMSRSLEVKIARPFAVGRYEVTQAEWSAVMGDNPSEFKGMANPVENVSWKDANEFAKKLSAKTGEVYRLLSEAEWTYAYWAGRQPDTVYIWGSEASRAFANYGNDLCCGGLAQGNDQWVNTSPVGSFPANAFGLYDMAGNVWEWTQDCWNPDFGHVLVDGIANESGDCEERVLRGGSWYGDLEPLRFFYRQRNRTTHYDNHGGFRVARDL